MDTGEDGRVKEGGLQGTAEQEAGRAEALCSGPGWELGVSECGCDGRQS